jgi:hypothetical protein
MSEIWENVAGCGHDPFSLTRAPHTTSISRKKKDESSMSS